MIKNIQRTREIEAILRNNSVLKCSEMLVNILGYRMSGGTIWKLKNLWGIPQLKKSRTKKEEMRDNLKTKNEPTQFVPIKHSFARFRLEQNGYKIFHNGHRILEPVVTNDPNYKTRWMYDTFKTEIVHGVSPFSSDINPTRIIMDYQELIDKTNLIISSRTPRKIKFFGQKVEYYLTQNNKLKVDLNLIPPNHSVEIDFQNYRARILGRSADQSWVYYTRDYATDNEDNLYTFAVHDFIEEVKEPIPVKNDLILGVCLDDGRYVGIPEQNFNPVIGIFGIRRSGKSWTLTRLLDLIYHKWKKKNIVMDDPMREMDAHCLEWKNEIFIKQLQSINESTRSLPLVFLHPKTNTLKSIMCKDEVGFEISLPFKELILDYENVLRGKKNWEFDKTAVYFRNLLYDDYGKIRKDGLVSCKDYRGMKKMVDEEIPPKLTGVKDKVNNVMKDILNSKILDISNGISPYWDVQMPDNTVNKLHPWEALLLSDIIPVIVTADIRHHFFYPQYMKFIMDSLFMNQTDNDLFIKNNSEIFMYFDEVTSVINSGTPTVANEIFEQIVRESGPARIGVVYATQDVALVPKFVRKQSTYILAFNQDAEGAKTLVDDFAALNYVKRELKKLNQFECVIFSKMSPIHLYDKQGNCQEVVNRPIRMKVFPPLSSHKAPKKVAG